MTYQIGNGTIYCTSVIRKYHKLDLGWVVMAGRNVVNLDPAHSMGIDSGFDYELDCGCGHDKNIKDLSGPVVISQARCLNL